MHRKRAPQRHIDCILMNIYCSAARLKGFERDLHLEGTQFASILGVLYVGYLTMQIPSFVVHFELLTFDQLSRLF